MSSKPDDLDIPLGTRHEPETAQERARSFADTAKAVGFSADEIAQLRQIYGASVDADRDTAPSK